jgi:coproporphyrinogen III oxidase-like Fe-S oxidoreductase
VTRGALAEKLIFAQLVEVPEALLDASKEVGLEVNPEKTKYMLVSRCQKAGQRQSIKIGNRSFESVEKFKYLGTTLTVKIVSMKRLRAD